MSKKRITWIVIACVLGAALIAGAVIYVAVILPQQKAHDEQMRLVQRLHYMNMKTNSMTIMRWMLLLLVTA